MLRKLFFIAIALILTAGIASALLSKKHFILVSPAFYDKELIPAQYTCDGENISPELSWSGVPAGTKSFALIMDDPDAPQPKPWVHWVIFNIPADTTTIAEGAQDGFISGPTDFYYMEHGAWQYGGPCPPQGEHRYFFTLYALDTLLDLKPDDAEKEALLQAMQGHILDKAQLVGRYQRMAQG